MFSQIWFFIHPNIVFSALCLALILLTQYVVPNIEVHKNYKVHQGSLVWLRQKMLYFVANNYYIYISTWKYMYTLQAISLWELRLKPFYREILYQGCHNM